MWWFCRAFVCFFIFYFLGFFQGGADIYEVSMVKTSCGKAGHTLADYQVLII